MFVVEHSAHVAREIAERAYVLQNGEDFVLKVQPAYLLASDEVRRVYFGAVT